MSHLGVDKEPSESGYENKKNRLSLSDKARTTNFQGTTLTRWEMLCRGGSLQILRADISNRLFISYLL